MYPDTYVGTYIFTNLDRSLKGHKKSVIIVFIIKKQYRFVATDDLLSNLKKEEVLIFIDLS